MDSSFVVSHLLNDKHTDSARYLIHETGRAGWISELVRMEVHNSTLRKVGTEGFESFHAARMLRFFEEQIEDGWFRLIPFKFVKVNQCAMRLIERYSSDLKVRTLDILHVAHAMEFGADSLWTFDDRQNRLAEAVGIAVNRLD